MSDIKAVETPNRRNRLSLSTVEYLPKTNLRRSLDRSINTSLPGLGEETPYQNKSFMI